MYSLLQVEECVCLIAMLRELQWREIHTFVLTLPLIPFLTAFSTRAGETKMERPEERERERERERECV